MIIENEEGKKGEERGKSHQQLILFKNIFKVDICCLHQSSVFAGNLFGRKKRRTNLRFNT